MSQSTNRNHDDAKYDDSDHPYHLDSSQYKAKEEKKLGGYDDIHDTSSLTATTKTLFGEDVPSMQDDERVFSKRDDTDDITRDQHVIGDPTNQSLSDRYSSYTSDYDVLRYYGGDIDQEIDDDVNLFKFDHKILPHHHDETTTAATTIHPQQHHHHHRRLPPLESTLPINNNIEYQHTPGQSGTMTNKMNGTTTVPRFAPTLFTTTQTRFDRTERLPTQPPQLHRDLQRKLRIEQGLDPDPPIPHEEDVSTKLRNWLEDVKDKFLPSDDDDDGKHPVQQQYQQQQQQYQQQQQQQQQQGAVKGIAEITRYDGGVVSLPPAHTSPLLKRLAVSMPPAPTTTTATPTIIQPKKDEFVDKRQQYYAKKKTSDDVETEYQDRLRQLEQREKKIASHVQRYTSPGSVVPVHVPLYVRPPALSHDYLLQLPSPDDLEHTWITEPAPMVYLPHHVFTNRNIVSRLPFKFWPKMLNSREQILLRLDENVIRGRDDDDDDDGRGSGPLGGGGRSRRSHSPYQRHHQHQGQQTSDGAVTNIGGVITPYATHQHVEDFIKRHIDLLSDPLFYQWTYTAQQTFHPDKEITHEALQQAPHQQQQQRRIGTRYDDTHEPLYTTVNEDIINHYKRGGEFHPVFFYGRDDYGHRIDHPEYGEYHGYPIYGYSQRDEDSDKEETMHDITGKTKSTRQHHEDELLDYQMPMIPRDDDDQRVKDYKQRDQQIKQDQVEEIPYLVVEPLQQSTTPTTVTPNEMNITHKQQQSTTIPSLAPNKLNKVVDMSSKVTKLRPIRDRLFEIQINRNPKPTEVEKQNAHLQKVLEEFGNDPVKVRNHFKRHLSHQTPDWLKPNMGPWNEFTNRLDLPDFTSSIPYAEAMRDLYLHNVHINTPFDCQQPKRYFSKIAHPASENEIIGRSDRRQPWSIPSGKRDRNDPDYVTYALPTPYKQRAYILHGIDDLLEDRNYYRQRFSPDPFAQELLRYELKNNVFLHKGKRIPVTEENRYLIEDNGLPSPVVDYSYNKKLFDPQMYLKRYYGSFHDDYVRFDGKDPLRVTYPAERKRGVSGRNGNQSNNNDTVSAFAGNAGSLSFVDHYGHLHTHNYETRMHQRYKQNRILKRLREVWHENIAPTLNTWALHLNTVLPRDDRDTIDNSPIMIEYRKELEHREGLKQWKKDRQEMMASSTHGSGAAADGDSDDVSGSGTNNTYGDDNQSNHNGKTYTPSSLPVTSSQREYNPNILAPIRQSFIYAPSEKKKYKTPPGYENLRTSNYFTDDQRKLQEYMIRKRYDVNTYTNPDGTKRPLSNTRVDVRYFTDIIKENSQRYDKKHQRNWIRRWHDRVIQPYMYHPEYHPESNNPLRGRLLEFDKELSNNTATTTTSSPSSSSKVMSQGTTDDGNVSLKVPPTSTSSSWDGDRDILSRPSQKTYTYQSNERLSTPTEIEPHHAMDQQPTSLPAAIDEQWKHAKKEIKEYAEDLGEAARAAQEQIRYGLRHGYQDAKDYTLEHSGRNLGTFKYSTDGSSDTRDYTMSSNVQDGRDYNRSSISSSSSSSSYPQRYKMSHNANPKEKPTEAYNNSSPWEAGFDEWFIPIYDWGGLFG